jgi:hypothetical protein
VNVVLFGSEEFDVGNVDRDSLRLGPAGAKPIERFGRAFVFGRKDLNHDGHRDLFAVFQLSELGLAYGDRELCLTAETLGGRVLEGCDEIDTMPRWLQWSTWSRGSRWQRSRSESKRSGGSFGRVR